MSRAPLMFALAAACIALSPSLSHAQGQHPYYLHALSDLRLARAHLRRPDGGALRHEEQDAIHDIDDAIGDIKRASIDDGKNLDDHPPVDANLDWGGRLHKARELLDKAHDDVAHEEDDPAAVGLKDRALRHIDGAHHHVDEAIHIVG
jgi:hypothetical protein